MPIDQRILAQLNAPGAKFVIVLPLPVIDGGPTMIFEPGHGIAGDELARGCGILLSSAAKLVDTISHELPDAKFFMDLVHEWERVTPDEEKLEIHEPAEKRTV